MAKRKKRKTKQAKGLETLCREVRREVLYNKAKPNRQARRLGAVAEEPKKEEKKSINRAEVLTNRVQFAKEQQKRIVPPNMTYGEYMEYLKEKRQQLDEKIGK